MKRSAICVLTLLIFLALVMPTLEVWAKPLKSRLVDGAQLLDSGEEAQLLSELDAISEKWQMDVVVVTASDLYGLSVEDYSDDFYVQGGYAEDGILLLVSMEDRDVIITPYERGVEVFTNSGCAYILESITDDLSDGAYEDAFDIFVEQCDAFFEQAENDAPYDAHNLPSPPFNVLKSILISLGIGVVLALIVTGVMKGQLKSVRPQSAADHYIENGSLNITRKQDLFLYRNVIRREKPKNNSGGRSGGSSGGGRAGARGKF